MKKYIKATYVSSAFYTLLIGCFLSASCTHTTTTSDEVEANAIFPKGKRGPAENFTGSAWNTGLVDADSSYTTSVGNVYFEPGARSNWHTHPGGQILIITAGVGFHQIAGQPRQTLHKGDVVKCPPNTLHWHGASPDTGMQQLYIVPNTVALLSQNCS